MKNGLKYVGMFCLLIFFLLNVCPKSVCAKDVFNHIKTDAWEVEGMEQSVRQFGSLDNKIEKNRKLINTKDVNVAVDYLYDKAYKVVASAQDEVVYDHNQDNIDALFTGVEYIKVPIVDTDGNYGIATFLEQGNEIEFLGEKYDCVSSEDVVMNHLDTIEKSFQKQTVLQDVKTGYIQKYGISLIYTSDDQESYVMPYFENEAVEEAMGEQNILSSKVYLSDVFFTTLEKIIATKEYAESGDVSQGLVFKSTKHSIFNKVLLFLGIFVIVFLIIMVVQKWINKKVILCSGIILILIVLLGGWNFYHNGVKKIVFPILAGDNEYVKRKDINRQIKWINSMEYEEIEYSEGLDPGQKSGEAWEDYFNIVFWDGTEESYVYDGGDPEYVLIIKRDKTTHLYRIKK